MQAPELQLFDLEHLVRALNASLLDREEVIELGSFEQKKPKKVIFPYIAGKEIENQGKIPLIQTVYSKGILGIHGLNSEINLGYIFVETGCTETSSNDSERYEALRFRIKHPLALKGQKIIPRCNVKLLQETVGWEEPRQERRDHVRNYKVLWVRSDLSEVLPTEWFLGGKKVENYTIKGPEPQPY